MARSERWVTRRVTRHSAWITPNEEAGTVEITARDPLGQRYGKVVALGRSKAAWHEPKNLFITSPSQDDAGLARLLSISAFPKLTEVALKNLNTGQVVQMLTGRDTYRAQRHEVRQLRREERALVDEIQRGFDGPGSTSEMRARWADRKRLELESCRREIALAVEMLGKLKASGSHRPSGGDQLSIPAEEGDQLKLMAGSDRHHLRELREITVPRQSDNPAFVARGRRYHRLEPLRWEVDLARIRVGAREGQVEIRGLRDSASSAFPAGAMIEATNLASTDRRSSKPKRLEAGKQPAGDSLVVKAKPGDVIRLIIHEDDQHTRRELFVLVPRTQTAGGETIANQASAGADLRPAFIFDEQTVVQAERVFVSPATVESGAPKGHDVVRIAMTEGAVQPGSSVRIDSPEHLNVWEFGGAGNRPLDVITIPALAAQRLRLTVTSPQGDASRVEFQVPTRHRGADWRDGGAPHLPFFKIGETPTRVP